MGCSRLVSLTRAALEAAYATDAVQNAHMAHLERAHHTITTERIQQRTNNIQRSGLGDSENQLHRIVGQLL